MVKFSKQLQLQLVPEWKAAFCNYWQLKKELKKIKLQQQKLPHGVLQHSMRRKNTLASHLELFKVHQHDSISPMQDVYETELMEPLSQDENEKNFFLCLDQELNKVNQFYCNKEQEYIQRAEVLHKQLKKLMEMKISLDGQHMESASKRMLLPSISCISVTKKGRENEDGSGYTDKCCTRAMELEMMENINKQLASMATSMGSSEFGDEEQSLGDQDEDMRDYLTSNEQSPAIMKAHNHSIIHIPKRTASPIITISALSELLWDDVVAQFKKSASRNGKGEDGNITKKKIQYAKKMLRAALVEFYRGLGLLRSFSSLNMLAFAKILKKYDKITGRNASQTYLKFVERAHFNSSDKVFNMMDEVEKIFTKHFAKNDHKKAMMLLRPIKQKASHSITFLLGLFTGCSMALFAALIILFHLYVLPNSSLLERYMITAFPVFSMTFLILLHMFLYGWNIYMWRQVRINYTFIFEFCPKSVLKNREVLLVSIGLTTLLLGSMLAHLATYSNKASSFNPESILLAMILACLGLLFYPLDMFYQSSRICFLRSMKHIILSPFYKVVMADFFLADQLTSQVATLRYAEYVFCYLFGGHFQDHNSNACGGLQFHYLAYLISFLPYWWRLLQCMRRWVDEGDRAHLANGGKYLSAMVAAGMRLTYSYNPSIVWLVMFVISSTGATIYQLYWDIVVDWGLLQPKSKNPWLRDQLMLKRKPMYFVAIVLNIFLRLAWVQVLTRPQVRTLDHRLTDLLFASFEVIRRGHWNFYRLENEHLNNVGKYRAVKTVPLPFRYVDDAYE